MFCPNGGFFNYATRRICKLEPGGARCLIENCDSRSRSIKIYRFIRHKILLHSNVKALANRFISIGDLNEKIVSKYVPTEKIVRIDNAIEQPLNNQGLSKKIDSIVLIGRPSPEKGLSEVFSFLRRYKFRKEIIVIGGAHEDYFDIDISSLKVTFKGWLSKNDVFEELRKCTYMIFPSLWYEGCPLVVQEALAAGVPVMCASVNAGAEIVSKFNAGAIYDPHDYMSFKSALEEMDNSDQHRHFVENAQRDFLQALPTMHRHIESIENL